MIRHLRLSRSKNLTGPSVQHVCSLQLKCCFRCLHTVNHFASSLTHQPVSHSHPILTPRHVHFQRAKDWHPFDVAYTQGQTTLYTVASGVTISLCSPTSAWQKQRKAKTLHSCLLHKLCKRMTESRAMAALWVSYFPFVLACFLSVCKFCLKLKD